MFLLQLLAQLPPNTSLYFSFCSWLQLSCKALLKYSSHSFNSWSIKLPKIVKVTLMRPIHGKGYFTMLGQTMRNPYSNYSTKHTSQICQNIHGIYGDTFSDGSLLRFPLPSPIVIQGIIPVNSNPPTAIAPKRDLKWTELRWSNNNKPRFLGKGWNIFGEPDYPVNVWEMDATNSKWKVCHGISLSYSSYH